jgi:hypothetical protein
MNEPYLEELFAESTVLADGVGSGIELGAEIDGKLAVITIGITRILEQQGLIVSIWGSSDNVDWGSKPLASFPQKYYCGTSSMLLNLSKHKHVRYLRVKWQMKRWAKQETSGLCAFYVFAEGSGSRLRSRAVAAGDPWDLPDSELIPASLTPGIA